MQYNNAERDSRSGEANETGATNAKRTSRWGRIGELCLAGQTASLRTPGQYYTLYASVGQLAYLSGGLQDIPRALDI